MILEGAQKPGVILAVCSELPGKHSGPRARRWQGAEEMTHLELELHYNSRMSHICGHVQFSENLYRDGVSTTASNASDFQMYIWNVFFSLLH